MITEYTTNEQIALLIRSGEREHLPILWERVRRFVYKKAAEYYNRHSAQLPARGVELDDLKQSGYFAFLNAVDQYKPNSGYQFISFLSYPLQNEFNKLAGYRTDRARREPLNNAISGDQPSIAEDEYSVSILDTIADGASELPYNRILEHCYTEYAHNTLEACMQRFLSEYEASVIRRRFFADISLKAIAEADSKSIEAIRQTQRKAINKLRKPPSVRILRPLLYDDAPAFGVGLSAFRYVGSATELAAIYNLEHAPTL